MKKGLLLISLLLVLGLMPVYLRAAVSYGTMKNWTSHLTYEHIRQVVKVGNVVYARTNNAFFAVDTDTEEITTYSKLTGLHGSDVSCIGYDDYAGALVVEYVDGLIDLIDGDNITLMTDLKMKQLTSLKNAGAMVCHAGKMYMAMPFGIMVIDAKKREISDTYYIGTNSTEVNVLDIAFIGDSIYAISSSALYKASLSDNLTDYSLWLTDNSLLGSGDLQSLAAFDGALYLVRDGVLYRYSSASWTQVDSQTDWTAVMAKGTSLFAIRAGMPFEMVSGAWVAVPVTCAVNDVLKNAGTYWLAAGDDGLIRYSAASGTQTYRPEGPIVNYCWRIRWQGDKMIMVPGGYWASWYYRPGNIMTYSDGSWMNYAPTNFTYTDPQDGKVKNMIDFCDAAIDPFDPDHFFVASFGFGLLEFRNNAFYHHYMPSNCPLDKVTDEQWAYTWVDGLVFDKDGNLWMTNVSSAGVKVLMRDGTWVTNITNKAVNNLNRTHDLLIWNKNPNYKIISCARNDSYILSETGIGVFNDKGTLTNSSDDVAAFRSSFIDQDGKPIKPEKIFCISLSADGSLWVGTNEGLFVIDDPSQLLSGNACRRIKIPRNDGTNLADYLLGTEVIHCITEDGAGRKWIGTEASGLYLMSSDGTETIEHFTSENSPLPSDYIESVGIHKRTGEVFIGTGAGLVSYHSDAAEPADNYDNVYAYPNPVRADYAGIITITGLMDNSVVYILDSGGNLVCKTRSNGGVATWDGKNDTGRRVTPGVYSVLCNTADGSNHTVTKILVM